MTHTKEVAGDVRKLRAQLAASVDPEFREGQQRFFKHEVRSWGVRTADLKTIESEWKRAVRTWPHDRQMRFFENLLASGMLEEGALACHLARGTARNWGAEQFGVLSGWLDKYVSNWAVCDGLASWLLAACVRNEPGLMDELAGWTESPNRWRRRAAAVALLQEAKAGRHLDRVQDIAWRLGPDSDDMVRKGVGWLLKVAWSARPDEIYAFLTDGRERFSGITLRYAAEKMPKPERQRLLAKSES